MCAEKSAISLVAFAPLRLCIRMPLLVLRETAAYVVRLLELTFLIAPHEALIATGIDQFSRQFVLLRCLASSSASNARRSSGSFRTCTGIARRREPPVGSRPDFEGMVHIVAPVSTFTLLLALRCALETPGPRRRFTSIRSIFQSFMLVASGLLSTHCGH